MCGPSPWGTLPNTCFMRSRLDTMMADGSVTADIVRTGSQWSVVADSNSAPQTSHFIRLVVQQLVAPISTINSTARILVYG